MLGVAPSSSVESIKAQFRKLVLRCHPDKVPDKQEEFLRIQAAWETLSDVTARQEYDQQLKEEAMLANTTSSNHLEIDIDDMEYVHLFVNPQVVYLFGALMVCVMHCCSVMTKIEAYLHFLVDAAVCLKLRRMTWMPVTLISSAQGKWIFRLCFDWFRVCNEPV